ncbi:metalloregulator ArsR/SmtB family transcription factor [Parvibaculum sedimenti]|uniref:Metalloregulator ArsR/SmtB family transcription factor n=2 Tax=Parvibaculum sedimenti TaxID=2608632 RepID=A0A6N6VEI8_9HYPH|nr:metalloregulator ArsR/SmtB family transcription factor [Parvibaculum sedimenti]
MNICSYVVEMPQHTLTTTEPSLSDDKAVELAEMFRLLGDPSRLRIVVETLEGPQSVGHMADKLGLSSSLVSHHLRLLRAARLVTAERRGKQIFYRIHDAHVRHVIADMVAHVNEEPE